jgi:hypothetical protein
MEKSRLRVAAPTSVNVTVGRRSREYLTEREVERLIEAAKQNRCGHRDATAILVAYRHGLRAFRGGCAALGRHRPRHRAIARAQGQGRGCQRTSDIGPGKSGAAEAPARISNVALRLHLGAGARAYPHSLGRRMSSRFRRSYHQIQLHAGRRQLRLLDNARSHRRHPGYYDIKQQSKMIL